MTNEIVYRFGIREVVWSVYSAVQRRELGARSITVDTQCSGCDAVKMAVYGELEGKTHPQMESYLAMLGSLRTPGIHRSAPARGPQRPHGVNLCAIAKSATGAKLG